MGRSARTFGERVDAGLERRGSLRLLPHHLVGAGLLKELFLDSDEFLDAAVSDRQRFERVGFGHFERATLDHHDRVL